MARATIACDHDYGADDEACFDGADKCRGSGRDGRREGAQDDGETAVNLASRRPRGALIGKRQRKQHLNKEEARVLRTQAH